MSQSCRVWGTSQHWQVLLAEAPASTHTHTPPLQFVDVASRTFNFDRLVEIARVVTRNLNKVIDVNYYPVKEAEYSNKRHRPVGIGIQGMADAFAMLRYPFESPEAATLNRDIFEAIYYGAVDASCRECWREQWGGGVEQWIWVRD